MSEIEFDFPHLCAVFKAWGEREGLTQVAIEDEGGPSKPKQKELNDGTWRSQRPRSMAKKIDRGFGWPQGTAWRVLTQGLDPLVDQGSVGGSGDDHPRWVGSPGSRVNESRTDSEVLRAITAMSATLDQLVARDRDRASGDREKEARVDARFAALEARLEQLSRRVENANEPGS